MRQILTFARKSDSGSVKLHAVKIIKDSLEFMRSAIPATIDIQHEIKTNNDIILADESRLNQIVVNLFTNAAHAMKGKGGTLKIAVTDAPEHFKNNPDDFDLVITDQSVPYMTGKDLAVE